MRLPFGLIDRRAPARHARRRMPACARAPRVAVPAPTDVGERPRRPRRPREDMRAGWRRGPGVTAAAAPRFAGPSRTARTARRARRTDVSFLRLTNPGQDDDGEFAQRVPRARGGGPPDSAEILARLLRMHGHRAATADTARDAVARAERGTLRTCSSATSACPTATGATCFGTIKALYPSWASPSPATVPRPPRRLQARRLPRQPDQARDVRQDQAVLDDCAPNP
jgi:hypothetical protein